MHCQSEFASTSAAYSRLFRYSDRAALARVSASRTRASATPPIMHAINAIAETQRQVTRPQSCRFSFHRPWD
jgi:hypothetical protein